MFHEGQKNVSYFFLTVDGNFCSEALTSVMENLNHSNSQRSKGKEEVAITLIKQRKHAQAIIPQEKNKKKKGSLQFVDLTKVYGDSPSTKNQIPPQSSFSALCHLLGVTEGAQDCLRKPANLEGG